MNYTPLVHVGMTIWQKQLRREIKRKQRWYAVNSYTSKLNIDEAMTWIYNNRMNHDKIKGEYTIKRVKKPVHLFHSERVQAGFYLLLRRMTKIANIQGGAYGLGDDRYVMYEALAYLRDKCERYALLHYSRIRDKRTKEGQS